MLSSLVRGFLIAMRRLGWRRAQTDRRFVGELGGDAAYPLRFSMRSIPEAAAPATPIPCRALDDLANGAFALRRAVAAGGPAQGETSVERARHSIPHDWSIAT